MQRMVGTWSCATSHLMQVYDDLVKAITYMYTPRRGAIGNAVKKLRSELEEKLPVSLRPHYPALFHMQRATIYYEFHCRVFGTTM